MKKRGNVILFPIEKIADITRVGKLFDLDIVPVPDEAEEKAAKVKKEVKDLVNIVLHRLLLVMEEEGVDVVGFVGIKDGAFLGEAINSIIRKTKGIKHPFQDLVNEIFYFEDDVLKMNRKIKITLDELVK